jgi:hypothetical protein
MTASLDERFALGLKSAAGGCSSSPEGTLFKARRAAPQGLWPLKLEAIGITNKLYSKVWGRFSTPQVLEGYAAHLLSSMTGQA